VLVLDPVTFDYEHEDEDEDDDGKMALQNRPASIIA
jgi:hypothetical protein